jgi:hypothetical protein
VRSVLYGARRLQRDPREIERRASASRKFDGSSGRQAVRFTQSAERAAAPKPVEKAGHGVARFARHRRRRLGWAQRWFQSWRCGFPWFLVADGAHVQGPARRAERLSSLLGFVEAKFGRHWSAAIEPRRDSQGVFQPGSWAGARSTKPLQRTTGSRGYFAKRGSLAARPHSQNSLPRAETTTRAALQRAQTPMRAARRRSSSRDTRGV